MTRKVLLKIAAPLLVLSMFAVGTAQAAFTLYDQNGATFTTDAFFNTFYVYSSSDNEISGVDRDQSRVKMGFLPNYIGFNFSKKLDNMTVGGRSSFWVTINDSDENVTETGIDVRQFYGTIDGDWGQVLIGKDFGLFSRSNIFLDEILMGYGNVSDTLGLIDGTGVSFGNIGTGYIYPFPNAQITYRSPVLAGFRLAIGIVDPAHTADNFDSAVVPEESAPQFQGELTYLYTFEKGSVTAWAGFLQQTSEDAGDTDAEVDSKGVSYGIQAKYIGLSLTASGFDASGVGLLLGPGVDNTLGLPLLEADGDEVDSNGYLLQASYTYGPARVVASYGRNELETNPDEWENKTATGALFYTLNDHVKLVAEYNVNEISIGDLEEETKTIALGGVISF
ncbi:MAG: porin [Desulfuromonadales bacterium]|nr:porin [Desulfuromonadales bacterium]